MNTNKMNCEINVCDLADTNAISVLIYFRVKIYDWNFANNKKILMSL